MAWFDSWRRQVGADADVPAASVGGRRDAWTQARHDMVEEQLARRGITDSRVLEAMAGVPRHLFVPAEILREAYADHPVQIGWGQTISQPYIVGMMTQLAAVGPGIRVLEIGTGSGYQTAVLAWLGAEVHSLEVVPQLSAMAGERLGGLGLENVHLWCRDGYEGLPEFAPYEVILCTAAPETVPEALVQQLGEGGRLVLPVGDAEQTLRVITRTATGVQSRDVFGVRFVPMVHPERA